MKEAIGWTLVHSIWQGAAISAVLGSLMLFVRAPRIRYAAACLAMALMVLSFGLTLAHFLPSVSGTGQLLVKPALPAWRGLPEGSGDGSEVAFDALIPLLTPVWLVGVCLFYLRYAIGCWALFRLRRRGVCNVPLTWREILNRLARELKVTRPVLMMESMLTDSPAVLGHFKPVILLPLGFLSGMPVDQVEAILLHELAHISRWDYLVNAGQRIVEGLLFYHPAVWWVSHVIRTERENCCDDVVVNLRGDAHGYAQALTALEQKRIASEAVMAATGGSLMKRVKRLLRPEETASGGIWVPALAAAILIVSLAVALPARHISQEAHSQWDKWLNEDVVYIISDQEKAAFERLATDEERRHFVEQFWERRDPTPGTPENEFKEEHYRRIAYANSHWAKGTAGWKSDRGRIYIKFGPPDEIDSHPKGGSWIRPESEGGGTVMTYPFEDWRYYHFEGLGSLSIEFVDATGTGDLRMILDPKAKYRK